jgi:predicted nuclease of predicted toxin-antitoxin system
MGINATTIIELGMSGSSDPDVFAYAVAENYVLLTENLADFVTAIQAHETDELADRIVYLTAPAEDQWPSGVLRLRLP